MTDSIALEAAALTRNFALKRPKRVLQAVRGVSLRLYTGKTVALVGESGSGKSTLARMLLGLLPATSGDVYLFGNPIDRIDRLERARLIQPIFQDPYSSLNGKRRIGDIVATPLDVQRSVSSTERAARIARMLEQVGLPPEVAMRYPAEMSGGQRQRVAIARALIAEPKILICDEPTSALDVSVQAQILNLLQDLREQQNLSYLVVTHNIGVVSHLADRVAVMYLGRIVEEGPTNEVLNDPQHPYTELLLSSVLPLDPDHVLPPAGIEVEPPNQIDLPPGCAYQTRCPRASARCTQEDPISMVNQAGFVACHHPASDAYGPKQQTATFEITPLQDSADHCDEIGTHSHA